MTKSQGRAERTAVAAPSHPCELFGPGRVDSGASPRQDDKETRAGNGHR